MTQSAHWMPTRRRKEKADEDRDFVELDRKLIEKLHRRRQPAQAAKPHEPAADVLSEPAPLASAEP